MARNSQKSKEGKIDSKECFEAQSQKNMLNLETGDPTESNVNFGLSKTHEEGMQDIMTGKSFQIKAIDKDGTTSNKEIHIPPSVNKATLMVSSEGKFSPNNMEFEAVNVDYGDKAYSLDPTQGNNTIRTIEFPNLAPGHMVVISKEKTNWKRRAREVSNNMHTNQLVITWEKRREVPLMTQ